MTRKQFLSAIAAACFAPFATKQKPPITIPEADARWLNANPVLSGQSVYNNLKEQQEKYLIELKSRFRYGLNSSGNIILLEKDASA